MDKVNRMVASNMWATPLWYQAARIWPPAVNLNYPPPPTLVLPEHGLEKTLHKKIPVLTLEKEHAGQNPYTEKSLSWKFVRRQHQYMSKLQMGEDDAFVKTEEDLGPEIAEFIRMLEVTEDDHDITPYKFLKGSGMEKEPVASAKMLPTSKLSVFAINDNLAATKKVEAEIERARKRKAGLKPRDMGPTEMIEQRLSVRINEPAAFDPLHGTVGTLDRRKRFLLRELDSVGAESVQRRFTEQVSGTKQAIQQKLGQVNNPTAEYLAEKLLPDSEEVIQFREEVNEDAGAVEARLDAFYDEAAGVGLDQIKLRKGMSLLELVLQAEKLREFRQIVNVGSVPLAPSEGGEGEATHAEGSRLCEEDSANVAAFVQEWKDPDIMKERRARIEEELAMVQGGAHEAEWKAKTSEEAAAKLRADLLGYDEKPVDKNSVNHDKKNKYAGLEREMDAFFTSSLMEKMNERKERRKEAQAGGALPTNMHAGGS